MNLSVFPASDTAPRHEAILGAAFQTFCHYGFRRTSMEDIARAAGMSRAALYLHFRNKLDIHRALVQHYFDATLERMRAALATHDDPGSALAAAFLAKLGPEMDAICASPHGSELMDAHASTSADIIREGEARIITLLAAWLDQMVAAGHLSLAPLGGASSHEVATTFLAAFNGAKDPGIGLAGWRTNAARLAALFARGLRP